MLNQIENDIKEKNARFAREVAFAKESVMEDVADSCSFAAESERYVLEDVSDEELEKLDGMIHVNEEAESAVQVGRILNAGRPISMDEMICGVVEE